MGHCKHETNDDGSLQEALRKRSFACGEQDGIILFLLFEREDIFENEEVKLDHTSQFTKYQGYLVQEFSLLVARLTSKALCFSGIPRHHYFVIKGAKIRKMCSTHSRELQFCQRAGR